MNTIDINEIMIPDERGIRRVRFRALGTECLVQFRHQDDRTSLVFAAEFLGWLEQFEAKFSRFRPDSDVSRINESAGGDWVKVSPWMETMLDLAGDLHQLTQGIMDPTLLPLMRVWNWKSVHTQLPERSEIKSANDLCGFHKLQRKPGKVRLPKAGMGLDFGGFGKEYAVDQVAAIARKHAIRDALVDLGRDVYAMGGNGCHPFWHVGIEDGLNPGHCRGGLAVFNQAVAASGDYARRFEMNGVRYGHILDPRTGWPVSNGLRAVTALAPSCLQAGVYSTAVFVMGAREGIRLASCAKDVSVSVQSDFGVESMPDFIRKQVQAA